MQLQMELDQQTEQALESPTAADHKKRRKRSRWGAETEAGLKVLAGAEVEQGNPAGEQQQEQQPAAGATAVAAADAGGEAEAGRKKRRSRWEPETEAKPGVLAGLQIALPPSIAALVDAHVDPKVMELQRQLNIVNQKLQLMAQGKWVDEEPEERRSPSPEPVYNEHGARTNTREQRAKDKLTRQRNELITELIKASPTFKPPADYRPEKKFRKLRIPLEQYPGYNFIGLIIGPRGNTHRRLEQESNCKIAIRGRGSVKEGRSRKDAKPDPSDNEDLHVLVTGDTDQEVDRAAAMVERLLTPMDDSHNEHKQRQLRELAAINGTLRDHELVELPKEAEGDMYRLPEHMRDAVEAQYKRDVARVHGEDAVRFDDEYKSFMQELGGAPPEELAGLVPGRGQLGLGHHDRDRARDREPPGSDPCHLYVGYLAAHVTEPMLEGLFRSCGEVLDVVVVRDRHSGESKGFGFVRMGSEQAAATALQALDNYLIGNKRLAVRIKGRHGPAGRSGGLVAAPSGALPAGPSLPGAPGSDMHFPPPPPEDGDGGGATGATAAGAGAGWQQHPGAPTTEQQLQALMQRLGLDPDELLAAAAAAAGEDLPPGVGPEPPAAAAARSQAAAGSSGAAAAAGGYPGYYYDPYYGWVPYPAGHPAAAGAAASSQHNNALATGGLQQQQQEPPAPEPAPPGCEEEWEAAAAAAAYANAYGSYGGYDGGYEFDPLAHMTEEEYAAYTRDSDEPAAAAAGGSAEGGKGERKRPAVVQVVSLDPVEVERARIRREEEERVAKQQKEKERLQRMLNDRQAALNKSKQLAEEQQEQEQQQAPHSPKGGQLPPPPPPPAAAAAADRAGGRLGHGRPRGRSPSPSPVGRDRRGSGYDQRRSSSGYGPPGPGYRGRGASPGYGGGGGYRRGHYSRSRSRSRGFSRSRSRSFSRSRSRSRTRSRSRSASPRPAAAVAAAAAAAAAEKERESSPEEGEVEEGEAPAEAPAGGSRHRQGGRVSSRERRRRSRSCSRSRSRSRSRAPHRRGGGRSRSPPPFELPGRYFRGRGGGRGRSGRHGGGGYWEDERGGYHGPPPRGGGRFGGGGRRGGGWGNPPPPHMRDYASDYDHYSGQPVAGPRGYGMAAAAAAAAMRMRMAALTQMGMAAAGSGVVVYGWPGQQGAEEGEQYWEEDGEGAGAEQQQQAAQESGA